MSFNPHQPTLADVSREQWDVIVIGAGVAGASFAIQAAQKNKSVLLVDAVKFPRDKVCGGCLNPRAQTHLKNLGVLQSVIDAGAVSLETINIQTAKRSVRWAMPRMLSISRSTLDAILVQRASEVGVTFIDGVHAKVSSAKENTNSKLQEVTFEASDAQCVSSAIMVAVAAGLTRSAISQDTNWPKWIDAQSRIGASVLIDSESNASLHQRLHELLQHGTSDNQLLMLSGSVGYVGICATDGNKIDIATAIDPNHIKGRDGITNAVQSILDECRFDCVLMEKNLQWNATPALTRYSSIAAKNRVFLLGDSLGYVEPFTGEGMSWAMFAASRLAVLLDQSNLTDETASLEKCWNQWMSTHRSAKQSIARWVSRLARNHHHANWILTFLNYTPMVRNILLRKAMQ